MKMHLNVATRDLDGSVTFYRTLLLAQLEKHYAASLEGWDEHEVSHGPKQTVPS